MRRLKPPRSSSVPAWRERERKREREREREMEKGTTGREEILFIMEK
jgi:hypothetical protein